MNILVAHLGTHYVRIGGGVERATCEFANAMQKKRPSSQHPVYRYNGGRTIFPDKSTSKAV